MTIKIVSYEPMRKSEWDDFVSRAKNSHFMFYRDYMDYHADRFVDNSLMFYDEKKQLIALMPANLSNKSLYSHQGLSFGGLCMRKDITTSVVLNIFNSLIEFLRDTKQVEKLIYKRLPDFYTSYPSQEDLYALFILESKLFRRDVSSAIDLQRPLSIASIKTKSAKRALKNNIVISEESNLAEFWELLTLVLQSQHNVNPIHSLKEIEFLHQKFPSNIRCFAAKKDNKVIAGTLIFETPEVVHTQYLANGELGRKLFALDLLISELIKQYSNKKKYFDFGISTENMGRMLNAGLISQKEGFGARALVHDFFSLNLL